MLTSCVVAGGFTLMASFVVVPGSRSSTPKLLELLRA
jgi:hypothetical protein